MQDKRKNAIPDYEKLFGEENNSKNYQSANLLKAILKKNKKKIVFSELLFIVKNAATWVIPIVTAEVINIITNPGDKPLFKMAVCGVILFILLIQNIPTHVWYSKYTDSMLRTIGAGLRNTLIKKLQHLSITYHKEMETGRIQTKFLRDVEAIEFLNIHFVKNIIPCVLNVLIAIGVAISKSWIVTLFFALVIPLNVALLMFSRKAMSKNNRKLREETETVSVRVSNMLDMIMVTKAHGLEDKEIKNIENNIERLVKRSLSVDKVNAYFGSITWVLSNIMSAVCLFFNAYLAFVGKIEVGDVILYQNYFNTISNNVQMLISFFPDLTKGYESARSVSEVIFSNDIEDNTDKKRIKNVRGEIEFENVHYKYPGTDKETIKGLDLKVKEGECIAFVGASGSGKTTIMNMVIGFLMANEGTVKIDGNPIDKINLTDYRQFISVVPQNSILFTGSIRDNITYGLENVSEKRLNEVIRLSNIEEFAKDLPNGIDTVIGEGGDKLSGGQKQRISIARAIIRNPRILILDEATSALDNISEYQVQKAISGLVRGRTTFIVAHRLSTIRDADRIVVMDEGKCAEIGTYEELMKKKGKFYELKTLSDLNSSTTVEMI